MQKNNILGEKKTKKHKKTVFLKNNTVQGVRVSPGSVTPVYLSLDHGGAMSLNWRHVGAGLSGQRRGGALPLGLRHNGARVRWRHHDGALPLNGRHGGIGLSGHCHDGAVPRTLRHGGTRAR